MPQLPPQCVGCYPVKIKSAESHPVSARLLFRSVWLGTSLTFTSFRHRGVGRLLISVGFLFLRIFLNLGRSLFVLLADLVKLLHVVEELGAALKSDE